MKIIEINIGDILLNKCNVGNEVLVVTGKSLDVTRYGDVYITTEVIKSPIYGKGKEKIFTSLSLLRGVEKIA
tara:strand:+ start:20125 stop:20340 length:216 start_codon:yes stop_codon:yes gene_type:complete